MSYGLMGGNSVAEMKIKSVLFSIKNKYINNDEDFYRCATNLISAHLQSIKRLKDCEKRSQTYKSRWRNTQLKIHKCMIDLFEIDKLSRIERVNLLIKTYDDRRKKSFIKSRKKDIEPRQEVYDFYNSFILESNDTNTP